MLKRLASLQSDRRTLISLLAVAAIMPTAAQYPATGLTYVGIASGDLRYVASSQREDEWCWAASAQMILNWYGIPATQEMMVARIKGALVDAGGSDEDIGRALNGWAPSLEGTVSVVRSITASGPPNPTVLLTELSQRHPILLTFATGPSSGP
jgi:hypothetical protein